MKILIATGLFPPDIGGPATYSKLLSDELPKSGVTVSVESFGSVRRYPKGISHLVYAFKLLWRAREADIIFAQDTVSVGLPAVLVSHLLGKICVVRVPGDYAWEQAVQRYGVKESIDEFQSMTYGPRVGILRSIQKFVVRQADAVIAPSKYFADLVGRWGNSNTSAIYNGVDIAAIKALARGVSFRPKTIVSAGRLVPWKGFEMLIRAMKKLDGWKLEIAGDGPEMNRLKELIATEGLSDRVSLIGRVEKSELVKKIVSAEIFALNTHFESFSFQIVEAMAAGTPVITTNIGNIPEIIDNDVNGILITPDNEEDFVASVRRISSDQNMRKALVAEAAKKSEKFSIENTVRATYEALVTVSGSTTIKRTRRQFMAKLVRYLFSGGVAAVTDLVLLYVFTDVLHVWYVTSSVLAFLIAFGVSFVLQKFFTFQDHGTEGVRGQAAIYLAVTGTNLLINTALVYLTVHFLGMNYIVAQIVTSIIIAIESYVVYGMFIFKKTSKAA